MLDKIQAVFSLQAAGGRIKKKIFLAACITLLLAMVILLSSCQKPRTPSEELIAAMKKTSDAETFAASATFSFKLESQTEDPKDQAINEILSNITLHLLQKCDQKDLRYQLDLNLIYKGQNSGSLILYADLEKITLQSPFLSPRPFVFNWEDLPALTSQYLYGTQIHITDYFPLIFDEGLTTFKQIRDAAYHAYANFLAERVEVNPKKAHITLAEVEGEKTYPCTEYILNLNYDETLQNDYIEFSVAILENETIRSLLKEKITGFVEIAKNNGDLVTWPWTEEEIMDFVANVEPNLDLLVEFFTDAYPTTAPSIPDNQMKTDYRISVDESGLIRAMVINQTISLPGEENTSPNPVMNTALEMQWYNFGEQPAFLEFHPANAFDAGKASEEEWAAVIEEVKINSLGQLFINPLFQEIMRLSNMGN
ncbi:MAG TPA: hypothetical protein GXZ26_04990 [Firmicutes bacterium]|jgi:hypothetical protein|nr:hypothetical protein [Bacillota bacterium]